MDPDMVNGTALRGALAPAFTASRSPNSTSCPFSHSLAVIAMTVPTLPDDGEISTDKSYGDSRSSRVAGGEVASVEEVVTLSGVVRPAPSLAGGTVSRQALNTTTLRASAVKDTLIRKEG
ncbi:MAG TPA: hypothetical protein VGR26_07420 [Acidimicrobiales bacterium]|nr:hypothetical protein [Acidimicrobiales bacterium]